MNLDELRKKYPPGFPVEALPDGAKEERIDVYRICRSGRVDAASFLPTYLDELSMTKENHGAAHEIGYYSLSTFFKETDAKRALKFFRGKQPQAILAVGYTEPSCGLCQRTRERKRNAKSHVDWWLYQNAVPHIFFREICLEGGEDCAHSEPVF